MYSQLFGNAISGTASSLGYTANIGALVAGLVAVNEYVFIPGLEKIDITTTRKIWGEEAALKSEQDWYFIKQ